MHEGAGRKAEHAGGVRVEFAEGEGREAERRGRRESPGRGEGELSFQLHRYGIEDRNSPQNCNCTKPQRVYLDIK
jgi:hypothetical protein